MAAPSRSPVRRGWTFLASLGAYLFVFAILGRRWLAAATHSGPLHDLARGAHPSDAHFHTWILAWVHHALVSDPSKLFDAPIFHPAPRQLTGAENFLSSQVVFTPVASLTGNPVLAMNALCFLAYPAAALAMQGLVRSLGLPTTVAWVTGLLYALGPLHVPASFYGPNLVHAYPPLAALALVRLRRQPGWATAGLFALVMTLGLFSSLYMASMVGAAAAAWTLLEATRSGKGRARFVALAATCTVISLALVIAFLQPYRARATESSVARAAAAAEEAKPSPRQDGAPGGASAFAPPAALPLLWAGGGQVALALAGTGVVAALASGMTRVVAAGLCMIALGLGSAAAVLLNGGMPAALIGVVGFFRWIGRTQVLTAFGVGLLAASGLDAVVRRLRPLAGRAFLLAVVALELATDGARLVTPKLDRIGPDARDEVAHSEVGRIAWSQGGGALLELPEIARDGRDLRPDAMLAALRHGLPLVDGFTGYLPSHALALNFRIRDLPKRKALGELVDLTRLRWILLRPSDDWPDPAEHRRFATALTATPGIARFDVGDFVLFRVDLPQTNPSWSEAVASGQGIGRLPIEDRLRLEPWKVQGFLGRRTPTGQLHSWISVVRHASGALDEPTQRRVYDLAHAAAVGEVCGNSDSGRASGAPGDLLERFASPEVRALPPKARRRFDRRLDTTYRTAFHLFRADGSRRKPEFCAEAGREQARRPAAGT